MWNRRIAPFNRTVGAVALLGLMLAACGPSAAPAEPTRTPPPTFTPTPQEAATVVDPSVAATAQAQATQQAAPQPPAEGQQPAEGQVAATQPITTSTQPTTAQQAGAAPTGTPAPQPTATPQAAEVVVNSPINIRQGPGTTYNLLGSAQPGEHFTVTGKNPDGDWRQISYNGQPAWVFGQLVTPQNTGAIQVAQNIPAAPPPPPPTNTPVPQPTQPPAPAAPPPTPKSSYEFNIALLQKCDPNAGVTYVEGTTYKGGQPVSGYQVAFSYAPDGPIVAQIPSGPHQGYPGWREGFYSHILQTNGPREGNWFFWVVDDTGKRISEIANVHTDGTAGDGKCQQAVIDFDSR